MKIHFLFSKNREKNRINELLGDFSLFQEYRIPIFLPGANSAIVKKLKASPKSKELAKAVFTAFENEYDQSKYLEKKFLAQKQWPRIEDRFFSILKSLRLKPASKFYCYLSFYGPMGQYHTPNIIDVRVNTAGDIKDLPETIAHEIIHLVIHQKARGLKYEEIEGLVDLFFRLTEFRNLFPDYKFQNGIKHDIKVFKKHFPLTSTKA